MSSMGFLSSFNVWYKISIFFPCLVQDSCFPLSCRHLFTIFFVVYPRTSSNSDSPDNRVPRAVFTVTCFICVFPPDTSDFSKRGLTYWMLSRTPTRYSLLQTATRNQDCCRTLRFSNVLTVPVFVLHHRYNWLGFCENSCFPLFFSQWMTLFFAMTGFMIVLLQWNVLYLEKKWRKNISCYETYSVNDMLTVPGWQAESVCLFLLKELTKTKATKTTTIFMPVDQISDIITLVEKTSLDILDCANIRKKEGNNNQMGCSGSRRHRSPDMHSANLKGEYGYTS